jgi:hypothetical protein
MDTNHLPVWLGLLIPVTVLLRSLGWRLESHRHVEKRAQQINSYGSSASPSSTPSASLTRSRIRHDYLLAVEITHWPLTKE